MNNVFNRVTVYQPWENPYIESCPFKVVLMGIDPDDFVFVGIEDEDRAALEKGDISFTNTLKKYSDNYIVAYSGAITDSIGSPVNNIFYIDTSLGFIRRPASENISYFVDIVDGVIVITFIDRDMYPNLINKVNKRFNKVATYLK